MIKPILQNLLAVALLMSIPACDWIQSSFIDTVPFKGQVNRNPTVKVYLAIDGLAYKSVVEAQKQGSFSGGNWRLSKLISMFPSTSDASWTRILHTSPIEGYEYTYFDTDRDLIVNKGYLGLLKHIIPTFIDGLNTEAPYLKAFDYRGNGYSHSIGVYHDTFSNLSESFDTLFFLLDGRAETVSSFSAYLYEIDAIGHIYDKSDVVEALNILNKKIQHFKESHPERKFIFTILSDHGMDFVKVDPANLVSFQTEMKNVGVEPVESLKGRRDSSGVYAVPIDHVRVTYLTFHTNPDIIEEVASRLSTLRQVDVAVAKIPNPNLKTLKHFETGSDWYGIWENGKDVIHFGFIPAKNRYILDPTENFSRFGFNLPNEGNTKVTLSDEELFQITKNSAYPDIFFKVRSAFSQKLQKFPGNIFVSLKPGYVSEGFKLPWGGNDFSLAGFHGSLLDLGAVGTLLTEERDLPDAVRSDDFLSLFPDMRHNMETKGVQIYEGEVNSHLHY